jgi:hypothetical protein
MCGAIVSVLHDTPIVRCDYVQDERYAAGAGRAGAARVSFARHTNCAVRLFMAGTTPKQSRPASPIPPTPITIQGMSRGDYVN